MINRSIEAVVARLRFGDSDGDDHDIAADYIDALREAAGRVTCARCYNQRKSCPECGALRALLNKETPNDRHG